MTVSIKYMEVDPPIESVEIGGIKVAQDGPAELAIQIFVADAEGLMTPETAVEFFEAALTMVKQRIERG